MKISEIIEALVKPSVERAPKLPYDFDLDDLADQRDNSNPIVDRSAGWYSKGSEAEDPHEYKVKSWLPTDLKYDSKYHWIKAIKPYMGDNPYLPVYYDVKFIRDKNNMVRTEYTMEKLTHLDNLDQKRLQALAAKNFNYDNFWEQKVTVNTIVRCVRELLNQIRSGETTLRFDIDDDFKQALKLIAKLIDQKEEFGEDLHGGNIMARNTSRGLQLVITDPISDDSASIIGRK